MTFLSSVERRLRGRCAAEIECFVMEHPWPRILMRTGMPSEKGKASERASRDFCHPNSEETLDPESHRAKNMEQGTAMKPETSVIFTRVRALSAPVALALGTIIADKDVCSTLVSLSVG